MVTSRALPKPLNLNIVGYFILILILLGVTALPTQAASGQLPPVNNFATAQMKVQSIIHIDGMRLVSYGAGTLVMPDRTSLWLRSNESPELIEIVQIGGTIYLRQSGGPWEITNDIPISPDSFQPISAQFNEIQQYATSITEMGDAMVGSVPTKHYQVWISGEQILNMLGDSAGPLPGESRDLLLNSTFKYDFWIGTNDGFLHQQLNTVSMPATTFEGIEIPAITVESLVTYFDMNNPNLSVNAPI